MKNNNTKINIDRVIKNINFTNIHTPLIEAIVNSMHAIEDSNVKNGRIVVTFDRDKQTSLNLNEGESIPPCCLYNS